MSSWSSPPQTPRKSATEQLLESFSATRSYSSVSRARKESYSSASPDAFVTEEAGIMGSNTSRIEDFEPQTFLSGPESINSGGIGTPTLRSLFLDGDEDVGDMIVVGGSVDRKPRVFDSLPSPSESVASRRNLRPRSLQPSKQPSMADSKASPRRRSGWKLLTDIDVAPRSRKPRVSREERPEKEVVTGRRRIREQIATTTKVNRDTFLLAYKKYFLPLLPLNNYVRKLEDSRDIAEINTSPYRLLTEQPKGVKATMKPYQMSGLSFMVHMYENGMSCMLGDEMGLGKTLQTLSLFQYLEEHKPISSGPAELRPYLVVCPLSVLSSWVNEAAKFTPGLKVLRYHGPPTERQRLKKVATGEEDWYGNGLQQAKLGKGRKREFTNANGDSGDSKVPFHILVTTYETFEAEKGWFKTAFVWRYVVLDEGHKIKNNTTQVAMALQGLQAEYRMILTGTPLQNDLFEMWSLLHWLYPDVFTSNTSELFKNSFDLSHGKVATSVLDHARRLLELIMLRRMKSSPEVDLGLPPKTEILLFVPLTPYQRFWYTRLLTKAGDALFDDLFKNLKTKESNALDDEAHGTDTTLDKLQSFEHELEENPGEWTDAKELIGKSLEQEQKDLVGQSSWQKLNNLVMQLRKCCTHPYLLPNASPEPFLLGDHIVLGSGKFIVLKKLLQHIVLQQNDKVLVFSEFTRVLTCIEDLLHMIGGDGTSFKYMRLDGSTSRARRNLNIRLFNDQTSEYKVMLISTKAGGLGINLTSATNVIFMDETWNPQLTLQAEARAHRIGQTKPVTVYKISTQGTVEEQMMGRIRKKLYLSAKITESMRSLHGTAGKVSKRGRPAMNDSMPQLDTSQLKNLIRRGAQTLSHPEIDATEMVSWDLATILENCQDRINDVPGIEEASGADEEKWLSAMEKVETAVFDGKRYQKEIKDEKAMNILPDSVTRKDRRKGKNTTVMVDGYAINKESMACADWEAVPTLAGKDPRLADIKREKKPEINNQEFCQVCWDGGELVLCQGCPRSYHDHCLPKAFQGMAKGFRQFYCPQHECYDCSKKTTEAGGIVYRCRWCEHGFCEDCLDWTKAFLVGEQLMEFETLGFPRNEQAFYISCPECNELHEDNDARAFRDSQVAMFEADHATYLKSLQTSPTRKRKKASSVRSVDGSLTMASTLATNSEVSTPAEPMDVDELSDEFYGRRKRKMATASADNIRLKLKMKRVA